MKTKSRPSTPHKIANASCAPGLEMGSTHGGDEGYGAGGGDGEWPQSGGVASEERRELVSSEGKR